MRFPWPGGALPPGYPRGGTLVVVPYVTGVVRDATQDAISACGQRHVFVELDAGDPYAYGKLLAELWNHDTDLVMVEHDMVPTAAQIRGLLDCSGLWCSHPYHVGSGRYTQGLGLCKFSHVLQRNLPMAGYLAAMSARGEAYRMHWAGLNESIERALTRRKIIMHLHESAVEHLHYPVGQDA